MKPISDRGSLNLGCGNHIRDPEIWVNHDIRKHREEVEVTHDLNDIPWPWDDDSFSVVLSVSVFEHLSNDLPTTMDECWRILRPDGFLRIKYPLYSSPFVHHDPTHRWYWSDETLDFFDPTTNRGRRRYYRTERHWKILEKHTGSKRRNLWAIMSPMKMIKLHLRNEDRGVIRETLLSRSRSAHRALEDGKQIRAQTRPYQSLLLYILAEQYNGGTIVDLGSYHGHSAYILAKAAPDAHVTTVDVKDSATEKSKENLHGLVDNVIFVTACSWELAAEWGRKVDMVFVDANHTHVERDLVWFGHLNPKGLMLFHDYTPGSSPNVVKAVDSLCTELGKDPEILVTDSQGVGMAGVYNGS